MSHPLSPPPEQPEPSQASPTRRLKACENCRLRKIKCPGPDDSLDGVCTSCHKANRPCLFRAKTVVKRRRRVEGRIRDLEQRILDLSDHLQGYGAAAPERRGSGASSDDHDMSPPGLVGSQGKSEVDSDSEEGRERKSKMEMTQEKEKRLTHSIQTTPSWQHKAAHPHQQFEQFFSSLRSLAPSLGIGLASYDAGAARLLTHFEKEAVNAFGPPWLSTILREHCLSLASQAPFLLHTMCAFAALHLKELGDTDSPVVQQTIGHLLDHHFQLGLRLYSAELSKPATPETMDALLAACMLFAMIAYATHSPCSVSDRSTGSLATDNLAWLTSQTGFNVIKDSPSLQAHLSQSIWHKLLKESQFHANRLAASLDVAAVPADWLALCPVPVGGCYEDSPYACALKYLAHVKEIDPTVPENFSYFICFPGHMSREFKQRVTQGDHGAMLFLLHWLAKMFAMDYWWSHRCVLMEGRAIFRRLETECAEDVVVGRLLEMVRGVFGTVID